LSLYEVISWFHAFAFSKCNLHRYDADGKQFWEALDEAVSPRIREIATNMATKEDDEGNFMSSVAEAAEVAEEAAMDGCDDLRGLFAGQSLKKGTRWGCASSTNPVVP
jgi:hypothetical protein